MTKNFARSRIFGDLKFGEIYFHSKISSALSCTLSAGPSNRLLAALPLSLFLGPASNREKSLDEEEFRLQKRLWKMISSCRIVKVLVGQTVASPWALRSTEAVTPREGGPEGLPIKSQDL